MEVSLKFVAKNGGDCNLHMLFLKGCLHWASLHAAC